MNVTGKVEFCNTKQFTAKVTSRNKATTLLCVKTT